jgi:DNA-binding NarL/FixJ family response regulator
VLAPTPTHRAVPLGSVLLVDDDRLFTEALERALTFAGVQVAGSAASGGEAMDALGALSPTAALIDLRLPDGPGLAFGRQMRSRIPGLRLVALSTDEDRAVLRTLPRAGFSGCVSKQSGVARIVAALNPCERAGVWEATGPARTERTARDADLDRLTRREREVLSLLSQGFRSQLIAERLEVELTTVRSHVQMILTKLQVHSRFEAVVLASGC